MYISFDMIIIDCASYGLSTICDSMISLDWIIHVVLMELLMYRRVSGVCIGSIIPWWVPRLDCMR